ncbi:MAG TPA: hypothetical protein VH593_00220 [Ktedonobacteraceae bacterium]
MDQLVYELQRQSSQQEIAAYFLAGNAYAINAEISQWVESHSKYATPASVSIDESIQAHGGNLGAIQTANLTTTGFRTFGIFSGAGLYGYVGGIWTLQF